MTKTDCALCKGYAEGEGVWFGEGEERYVCKQCESILARKLNALLGINSSWSTYGVEVEWHEIKRILDSLNRDALTRVNQRTFVLTDRAACEAEVPA